MRMAFLVWLCLMSFVTAEEVPLIAFGSCYHQSHKPDIWTAVHAARPDVWIWLGDNVYADTEDMDKMKGLYDRLLSLPGYEKVRKSCRVIGTWDDHDYGKNDAGKEFPMKVESQRQLLDFLDEPKDSPRRRQEGVYASYDLGTGKNTVRVILLDTRYHRDTPGEDGDVLGELQWSWLKENLASSPARLNIIGSSIQVIPEEHRFEKWANFPKARQRLLDLIGTVSKAPCVLLSGDRHRAEISRMELKSGPLYEVTSSSLNLSFPNKDPQPERNRYRLGEQYGGNNFGVIGIDWKASPPMISMEIRNKENQKVLVEQLALVRSE